MLYIYPSEAQAISFKKIARVLMCGKVRRIGSAIQCGPDVYEHVMTHSRMPEAIAIAEVYRMVKGA